MKKKESIQIKQKVIPNDCPINQTKIADQSINISFHQRKREKKKRNLVQLRQQAMSEVSQQARRKDKKKKIPQQLKKAIKNQAQKGDGIRNQCEKNIKQKSLSSNHLKQHQKFLCQICQRYFDVTLKQQICSCKHSFCKECLNHYVLYKIRMFQKITCPDQFCDSQLNQNSQFYKNLPSQIRKKYKKNNQFYAALQNPNLRLCPKQKCDGVLKITGQKTSKCQKCKRRFCSHCFLKQHQGACQSHQVQFFQTNFHYKQCSRCKMIVQKISGCNHITCICGNNFCYLCGLAWHKNHLCNNYFQNYQNFRPRQPQTIQNVFPRERSCLCCDRICGPAIADIFKWPLKFLLFLINLLFTFFLFQAALMMTPQIFMLLLMGGFIVGPFVFLSRLWDDEKILLMVLMIVLFPLSILMGIKISMAEWFFSVIKYQCQIISDFFLSFCDCIKSF